MGRLRRVADIGGKARGLAIAEEAGLAVPEYTVLLPGAEAAPPAGEGPWIVRSSATTEDAAPGIFTSVRDVSPPDFRAAVAEVRASIDSPVARAYFGSRGLDAGAMAVIVQRQIAGVRGTAWSRSPDGQPGVLIEAEQDRALVDGVAVHGTIPGAPLVEIAAAARRLEVALGGPADVEWVAGERLYVVQARRIPAAGLRPPVVPPDELHAALAFSRAEPEAVWTWDAEHNPAPLSLAQAGLVALVDEARAASVRQRIVLGYLYTTRTGGAAPERIIEAARLADVYHAEIAPAFEAELARMGDDLEATLAAYVRFYRRYALELAPSLARAPGVTVALPPIPAADLAPGWDVAEPTYAERGLVGTVGLPQTLRDLDDIYFARAQTGVRRALVAQGRRWGVPDGAIFDLPLDEARAAAGSPQEAAARAAGHRADRERLSAFTPPVQIAGGRPLFGLPGTSRTVLRGHGLGGRARGRIARLDAHLSDRILIAATIIPTMAPLLVGARGVIAEHGGLLGHGVALARELGVPCLVGCTGALALLADGDEVLLDADAGVAVKIGG